MTRKELADRIGISYNKLHNMERSSIAVCCLCDMIYRDSWQKKRCIDFVIMLYDIMDGTLMRGLDPLILTKSKILDAAYYDLYDSIIDTAKQLGLSISVYDENKGRYL
jgi:hypothetical protein